MTQNEIAEASGLSNRTYADIESGSVKMRVDTIIHICKAQCLFSQRQTALQLLSVYLKSLE